MIEPLKNYISKKVDLLKLEAVEKTSLMVGNALFMTIMIVFAFFFLLLLFVGLGLWLGHLLGNYGYGVLIMSGLCLVLFLVFFWQRKAVLNFISNRIIKSLNI